jgi:hypothetical protein
MPRNAPATATVAKAIAAAIALTRRALTPTRPTVSGSSAVARIDRPTSVRLRKASMPPRSDRHGQRRELADGDVVAERPAVVGEIADIGRERAGVGAEALEQEVVDNDRQPEGRQHRHQKPAAGAAFEHQALQRPADQRHQRRDDQEAEKRLDREPVGQHIERVSGEHRQAAVGKVDDAHDAEHERQSARDQRVIAAEQHALKDLVDEDHDGAASPRGDFLRPK